MVDAPHNVVEVVCDGGSGYGYGHIRRSYTLARALESEDFSVKYTVLSKTNFFLKNEFAPTETDPVIQVLDLPYEIQPWVDRANEKDIPTIALDYFDDARPTLTISIYEHRNPPPGGRRLAGLDYAIIRPEILRLAPAAIGNGIVVIIGGSDINQVGGCCASRLTEAGKEVYLIQGPGNTEGYPSDLPNVTVLHDPDDLGSLMATCEWAVTNGGGSMMEMMSLGKAVHVVPQTNDELRLAEIVFNRGGLLGIGLDSLRVPSIEEIKKVGKRARKLVDGQGVHRIVDLISSFSSG